MPTSLLLEEGATLLDRWEEPVCYKVCCAMATKGVELACAGETDLQHTEVCIAHNCGVYSSIMSISGTGGWLHSRLVDSIQTSVTRNAAALRTILPML